MDVVRVLTLNMWGEQPPLERRMQMIMAGIKELRPDVVALQGVSTGGTNWLGQGVDVTSYRRLRDEFLDASSRAQNMLLGQRRVGQQLGRVELL